MAYTVAAPQGDDYVGQQWAHCMLLANAYRLGKHAVVLAGVGNKLVNTMQATRADQVRANQTPPPKVM